jgi:hypothetical protein
MSWKRKDVLDGKRYYVALCQSATGRRYYELCEIGSPPVSTEAVLQTGETPSSLLISGDFEGISNTVRLTNGSRFHVEAHGIWLTESELEALEQDDEPEVPWFNGIPASFPPR